MACQAALTWLYPNVQAVSPLGALLCSRYHHVGCHGVAPAWVQATGIAHGSSRTQHEQLLLLVRLITTVDCSGPRRAVIAITLASFCPPDRPLRARTSRQSPSTTTKKPIEARIGGRAKVAGQQWPCKGMDTEEYAGEGGEPDESKRWPPRRKEVLGGPRMGHHSFRQDMGQGVERQSGCPWYDNTDDPGTSHATNPP